MSKSNPKTSNRDWSSADRASLERLAEAEESLVAAINADSTDVSNETSEVHAALIELRAQCPQYRVQSDVFADVTTLVQRCLQTPNGFTQEDIKNLAKLVTERTREQKDKTSQNDK